MKFKIGDKVKIIACEDDYCDKDCVGKTTTIIGIGTDNEYPYIVERIGNMDEIFKDSELQLVKPAKAKPVIYVVGWETDEDPYRTFTSESEMRGYLTELAKDDDVEKDSIEVFEVKKHYKVSFDFKTKLTAV